MEGGKNFYCYNGATPVTSAMLSVRYMVTKSIQPQNELTTLVGNAEIIICIGITTHFRLVL